MKILKKISHVFTFFVSILCVHVRMKYICCTFLLYSTVSFILHHSTSTVQLYSMNMLYSTVVFFITRDVNIMNIIYCNSLHSFSYIKFISHSLTVQYLGSIHIHTDTTVLYPIDLSDNLNRKYFFFGFANSYSFSSS